ncbi:MAG: NfeD family protein [Mycobacteriales bacterium]
MPNWLLWLGAAAVLAAAELLSLDLVLIMLAAGAAAAAAAAAFDTPLILEAIVFAIVSAALLLVVRPIARRHLRVGHTRTGVESLTGAPAVVLEPVDGHSGQVKIGGEVWSARAFDSTQAFSPGEHVHVMEISGATALVWRQP